MSIYNRKVHDKPIAGAFPKPSADDPIPNTNWRGHGLFGGWDHVVNGDCSFLSGGEERNWWFQGEESWDFPLVKETKDGAVGAVAGVAAGGPGAVPEEGKMEAVAAEVREGSKI